MKILITGGTGSLGSQLVRHFSQKDWRVTVFSRDPHKQVALRREFPHVRFVLGDICDYEKLARLCEGQDMAVHAAALKHVDVGEENVDEFIRVNVTGAQTVARACSDGCVPVSLFISSDKAVDPINLYGRTKAVGEDVFLSYGYSALRYGNVINSRGAFVDVWRQLIAAGKPITLRRPDPTRFYLRISDAVNLVQVALDEYFGGEVFIPARLKSFSVEQAVEVLGYGASVQFADLLPGEKQHELLLSRHEYGEVVNDTLCRVAKGYAPGIDRWDYSSETAPRMTDTELLEALLGG